MKSVGIITIHKINNYGSVLQAYALQKVFENMGCKVEIIDYNFPNEYHIQHQYTIKDNNQPNEPSWIKMLYAFDLIRQHRSINAFVSKYQHLSKIQYHSPDELKRTPPKYDIYITGSDQLWNPHHCGGDPAFLLHFAPENALKASYAASMCINVLPTELTNLYCSLLNKYQFISVREFSSVQVIKNLTGKNVSNVLDPTLLLDRNQWNEIASKKRIVKKKYILCYFLNYTFNAFPYVDYLAKYIQQQTGYEIVRVARPPHQLIISHTIYKIAASPEDFLALVRDAEIVLTTSFHGTAFAVNYGKPVFTVVQNKTASDSRQVDLMYSLGLDKQILSINDKMPDISKSNYDSVKEQNVLETLRQKSIDYLKMILEYEQDTIMR